MKSIKLTLALAVLCFAVVGILWLLEIITPDQAIDYGGKSVGVFVLIGIASAVILKVMGGNNPPPSNPNSPGPKF